MLRNAKVKAWPRLVHITDRNTCLEKIRKEKCSGFFFFFLFFFSQLELTFSLAVNETKQRRVIRVDVFIRGFYRKLISWGMQSCAKLMARGGGCWHSFRNAAASEYVFTFRAYTVPAAGLSISNSSKHGLFFQFKQQGKVRMWCGSAKNLPRSPLKLHMKQILVTQRLARFRCCWSTSNMKPWFHKTSQSVPAERSVGKEDLSMFTPPLETFSCR